MGLTHSIPACLEPSLVQRLMLPNRWNKKADPPSQRSHRTVPNRGPVERPTGEETGMEQGSIATATAEA
jgi:hypothetical protein